MISRYKSKPPSYVDRQFYSKCLEPFSGIYVLSHSDVADDALMRVVHLLENMVKSLPLSVIENLYNMHFRVNVIGEHQQLTDMPEWKYTKDSLNEEEIDSVRSCSNSAIWIGEDELLHLNSSKLPKDQELFVQEFAKVLYVHGVDEECKRNIRRIFASSMDKHLWRGAKASANEKEYFSQLSMWYFGYKGDIPADDPFNDFPGKGKDELHLYDEEGYTLMDEFFSGQTRIGVNYPLSRPSKELALSHQYAEPQGKLLKPDIGVIRRSYLVIRNDLETRLHLYGINSDGERILTREIEPFTVYIQASFDSYPYVVFYNDVKLDKEILYGYYVVEREATLAWINERNKPKKSSLVKNKIPELYFSLNGVLPLSRTMRGVSIC